MPIRTLLLAAALSSAAAFAHAEPRTATIKDPDTRAWWEIAEHLSSDAMEGRDTGSAGYDRAAEWVIARFKAAGLSPAGEGGGWTQTFPVHEAKWRATGRRSRSWARMARRRRSGSCTTSRCARPTACRRTWTRR